MLNKVYSPTPLLLNIIGALGAISTGLEKYITAVGIEIKVEHLQNITLLETARISRLVLGCQKNSIISMSIILQDLWQQVVFRCHRIRRSNKQQTLREDNKEA